MSMNEATAADLAPATARGLSVEARIWIGLAVFIAVVAAATVTWGAVGLAMCALACVPVCYAMILLITVGK
ncbi:hypothetical protein CSE45_0655 [Citreicella sp. SE45]|uniref:Uncharacterized protein n=1 Tax=Salipiger thiooxidans TaxID=282683 RepID=A0A1G7ALX5_9RHOB|nr:MULTISPECIES: hypothetical protein [Salipiger]EEX14354.1 hypothetical protein CSE45_0655 [Citreicella sp. SE45]MAU46875.1 hypothetical protein [Salipiger sp.]NVK62550.1 hypothetical protein [Paracoccaceae bacterium]NIY99461.1 hypothetical protein [Salipiger sp. HF18]SDE15005.1 hypothetical protein SAMN04488105_101200 [Salipiger thiooxidans]